MYFHSATVPRSMKLFLAVYIMKRLFTTLQLHLYMYMCKNCVYVHMYMYMYMYYNCNYNKALLVK